MRHQYLLLLMCAGLTACSGNNGASESGTGTSADVPTAFYGSWISDVPARTPPDPQPDHYDRTEYEISQDADTTSLTKWSAALDIKTRKEWFRNKLSGPLTCTYIPYRECLACGSARQFVKDSLFLVDGRLENRSPTASDRPAAGRGPLVLTRKPH
ncbi:hypothetical protein J2I47_07740 [Fibrella sp. HMF5335]|uniref:Lipoprotein n=1 Tax=Fibrella rubiginis TaxID=2817060 RepID=A0A939GDN5_9BACT|nr:hypothetical protein [Fibrella rubiginis]MBO0936436.1 hypothetical protein [Fibrella rubiginis]